MHPSILPNTDKPRGCGYRTQPGALYLCMKGRARGCGKLPIPLETCPCCGGGFKFSRTPVWLEQPERLWWGRECQAGQQQCNGCAMSNGYETGAALLMWIGEKFYPLPADWMRETELMGVSRRIQHVPKGFIVGETWVLVAHSKAIDRAPLNSPEPEYVPGIFSMFRPDRIEILVDGTESDETIEGYLKRGLTPVMIWKPEAPAPAAPTPEQTALL